MVGVVAGCGGTKVEFFEAPAADAATGDSGSMSADAAIVVDAAVESATPGIDAASPPESAPVSDVCVPIPQAQACGGCFAAAVVFDGCGGQYDCKTCSKCQLDSFAQGCHYAAAGSRYCSAGTLVYTGCAQNPATLYCCDVDGGM